MPGLEDELEDVWDEPEPVSPFCLQSVRPWAGKVALSYKDDTRKEVVGLTFDKWCGLEPVNSTTWEPRYVPSDGIYKVSHGGGLNYTREQLYLREVGALVTRLADPFFGNEGFTIKTYRAFINRQLPADEDQLSTESDAWLYFWHWLNESDGRSGLLLPKTKRLAQDTTLDDVEDINVEDL